MHCTCVRHTELPGVSALFADVLYHPDRTSSFYPHPIRDLEAYHAAAARIRLPEDRRAALVAALRGRNPASPALDRLAQPGTVAVVTGQQVGLFSGPAYTIYKALTAARLAVELSERGIPAVPVFWLATEDHDLAEVNHCFVFDAAGEPVRLEVNGSNGAARPVGGIRIEDPPLERLKQAFSGMPFGDEAYELAAAAYQPGATFAGAFEATLRPLLEKWGIVFIDPLDRGLRRIAAPLLRDALTHAGDLKQELLERNEELVRAGYHAQVLIEPHTSLFFLLDGERRISLR